MLIMESDKLANFLSSLKLIGAHCTVIIDKAKLCVDYVIVDDTCIYQYHENSLNYVYFDREDETTFAFEIPKIMEFVGEGASVKFSVHHNMKMIEMTCTKPSFSSVLKLNDNYSDKIDSLTGEFVSLKPYAQVMKAIKSLKSLATELSTTIRIELGKEFWSASVSQSCIFGAAKGIVGSMTSQLFERVYDYNAEIAQTSGTSLLLRKMLDHGYYLIHIPVSRNVELPNVIPKMVAQCKEVCTSQITNDVGQLTGEIIKSIKKDSITLKFTPNRLDLEYSNNSVSLTTVPAEIRNVKGVSITLPVKSLVGIVNILSEPTLVSTNGEFLCLMRDSNGLLVSGIIS